MVLLSRQMNKSVVAPDTFLFIVYGVHKSIPKIMDSVHVTTPCPADGRSRTRLLYF
jgi:hypothetical protein